MVTAKDIIEIAKNAKLDSDVDLDKIDVDKKIMEQGIDSLDFTKLLFEIEDTFGIEVPDEDYNAKSWDTINKIVEKVNALKVGN